MPKLKQNPLDEKRSIIRGIIKKNMEFCNMRNPEVATRIHCKERLFVYRKQKPESIRLSELWGLISVLKITDEEILQIVKGKKETK